MVDRDTSPWKEITFLQAAFGLLEFVASGSSVVPCCHLGKEQDAHFGSGHDDALGCWKLLDRRECVAGGLPIPYGHCGSGVAEGPSEGKPSSDWLNRQHAHGNAFPAQTAPTDPDHQHVVGSANQNLTNSQEFLLRVSQVLIG